jgi:hypothetical protein
MANVTVNTDKVTTIIGFILAIGAAGQQAIAGFQGQPINWIAVVGAVLVAAFGYWTNKKGTQNP